MTFFTKYNNPDNQFIIKNVNGSMTAVFSVLLNEVKHLTIQVCSLQVAHLACVLLPIVSMTGWWAWRRFFSSCWTKWNISLYKFAACK